VSFQSPLECVSVSNGTQVQWQIVPHLGTCFASVL